MEYSIINLLLLVLSFDVSLNQANTASSNAALVSSGGTIYGISRALTSSFSSINIKSVATYAPVSDTNFLSISTRTTREDIRTFTTNAITSSIEAGSPSWPFPVLQSSIIRSTQNSTFNSLNSSHTFESDTKLWSSSNTFFAYATSTPPTISYSVSTSFVKFNSIDQSRNTTVMNPLTVSASVIVSSMVNTSTTNHSTVSGFQGPTIQTTPYLISPSLPQYNTPVRLSQLTQQRSYNMSCRQVLQHFPDRLNISEHDSDKILVTIMHGTTTNITASVVFPENIVPTLDIHFKVQSINTYTKNIRLTQAVDIEQIYIDTKTVVNYIGLRIACSEKNMITWKTVNITVEDVDDNGPTFKHSDMSKCALPLYTAGAGEQFVGTLHLSPGAIRAVDGDLVKTNTISYSFLHGDPSNYQNYFTINYATGSVNKTSNITEADPHDFVIVVQATEESTIKRSKVAVLTVSVSLPTTPPTTAPYRANRTVITVLQILSVVVILSFTIGFAYIVRHRNRKQKVKDVNEEKPQLITYIDELMVSTSCKEDETCAQLDLVLQAPEPSLLSVPSPDPVPSTSQSPVSTRKVSFVLPEKTYRMIYGTRGRRNKKV